MSVRRAAILACSFLVLFGFLVLWQAASDARWISPVFLPGPQRVWAALMKGLASGDLLDKWLGTLQHMVYGWVLASALGIGLGTLSGSSPLARAYFQPLLELMRPLPASAIVPLAIALLGLSETMVLAVVGFGALWPMLLATLHGFSAVEPRLMEVSRLLQMNRLEVVTRIALPNALPDIVVGLRLSLTVALILSVVGEMLASRDGLGNWVLLAARSFRSADLYAGVVLLGLTGYLTSLCLTLVERRLLRWQVQR